MTSSITHAMNSKVWFMLILLSILWGGSFFFVGIAVNELAGATNVLLVTLLVPVSAVLLGLLFLNESLALIHFLGILLIALGLSFIDGRLWLRIRSAFA